MGILYETALIIGSFRCIMVTGFSIGMIAIAFASLLTCSGMVQTLQPLEEIASNEGTASIVNPNTRKLFGSYQTKGSTF